MQERTIFLTALEFKTPEARAAFLDEQCAQDAALRRHIEALLKAHEQQGGVVDAIIGSDEPTSSMHSLKEDAPPQPAVDPEDLNYLGPSSTPGCLGSLGPYEVIEVIGRGGMGLVFKARDTKLQRIVAIKVLAPEIAANKTAKRRFEREVPAAAVSHDHIVTIHAVDESNGLPYLVMECIVGRSLQQKIEETGPLELKEILRIGMQSVLGLAAAHKQGLVHRDIKPANILLQNGIQRVKITDFGLARATDDVGMTHTGQIAGTPLDLLHVLMGKVAATLRDQANGIDDRPLVPEREPQKSFSKQETFSGDLTDEEYIEAVLRRHQISLVEYQDPAAAGGLLDQHDFFIHMADNRAQIGQADGPAGDQEIRAGAACRYRAIARRRADRARLHDGRADGDDRKAAAGR